LQVKYLIIRLSSIGDIVLTTPVLRGLKSEVENAEIHNLVKKSFYPVIQANPYIDKILVYDNNLNQLIRQIKQEQYHYIIDLHHNLRSLLIKNRTRILAFSFNKLNFKKWLMVKFKINRLPEKHIVDRYLETVQLFDVKNDQQGLDYFIPETDTNAINKLPASFQNGYIAIVAGAKHNTKKLPQQKIIDFCNYIYYPLVLLGGKEDSENGSEIEAKTKAEVFNACGKLTINESAAMIRDSRLVITHDTGLMHIAAAFKKTIFSIWGNTIPEFGMYPYLPGKNSHIFEIKGLPCRPCSKIGYQQCPKKHFQCMENIDIYEIAEKANRIVKQE